MKKNVYFIIYVLDILVFPNFLRMRSAMIQNLYYLKMDITEYLREEIFDSEG